MADPISGQPADADTIYRIGSVSKTFTALAAMRWVDSGRLNLDDPVSNTVPAFSYHHRFPGAVTITSRMLLNHQSGLPGDYLPYAQTTVTYFQYGADVLAAMADEYPVYPPNFSDTYNNNGFTLMESLLATLSGTTFVSHVTSVILQPLGMTNLSFLYDPNRFNGKLVRSMIGTNSYPDEIVNVHGSGGIYSSANEMGWLIEMLLGNGEFRGQRLVSTNAMAVMLTFQGTNMAVASSNPATRNGLGWDNVADPKLAYAGRACYKGGDTACFHSHLEIMPDHGLGVAVMCNGAASAQDVAQYVLMVAFREKFGLPLPTNTVPLPDSPVVRDPPLPWEQIAGYYARQGGVFLVTTNNGSLSFYINPLDPAGIVYTNLVPHADGWFWATGTTNFQLTFSNVLDHVILFTRTSKGTYLNVTMQGECIAPAAISPAWADRAGKQWIVADLDPFNFSWAQNSVTPSTLAATKGFLFFSNVAFTPTNDQLAFPYISERNDAGTLKVVSTNGEEWLRLMGSHYRAVDLLPVLAAPGSVQAELAGDDIGWYSIPQPGNGLMELILTGVPLPQLRVLNADFHIVPTVLPVAGRMLVAQTGAVFVAVTKGLEGGDVYALRAFRRRVAADYDGDGKTDPAVYRAADGFWACMLSASKYTTIFANGFGGPDWTPVPADYDGDGKADPTIYRQADGLWICARTAYSYSTQTLFFGGTDYQAVR